MTIKTQATVNIEGQQDLHAIVDDLQELKRLINHHFHLNYTLKVLQRLFFYKMSERVPFMTQFEKFQRAAMQ